MVVHGNSQRAWHNTSYSSIRLYSGALISQNRITISFWINAGISVDVTAEQVQMCNISDSSLGISKPSVQKEKQGHGIVCPTWLTSSAKRTV